MSPDEAEALYFLGQTLLEMFWVIVFRTAIYGLYLAAFFYATQILLRRRPRTRHTWTLFGLALFVCALSTANFGVLITIPDILIRICLATFNANSSITDRLGAALQKGELIQRYTNWFTGATTGIQLFIGDAVVVWRACVIYPGNRIAKLGLLILLGIVFGSSLAATILTIVVSPGEILPLSSPTAIMQNVALFTSLATNVLATTLIGYKTYKHRESMKATIGLSHSTTSTVLFFMTETGFIYCIIQLVFVVLDLLDNTAWSSLDYATLIFQQLLLFASAIYPLLILFIIESKRSIADQTNISADSRLSKGSLGVGTHITFAQTPSTAATRSGADTRTDTLGDIEVGTASSGTDVEKTHSLKEIQETPTHP